MKNEKNYMGFLIIKIEQILKRFGGTKTLGKASYFWGVHYNALQKKKLPDHPSNKSVKNLLQNSLEKPNLRYAKKT